MKSVKNGNTIIFKNFIVIKKKDNFWGVYEKYPNNSYNINVITSGTTCDNACKKAKLLQTGYDLANEYNEQEL